MALGGKDKPERIASSSTAPVKGTGNGKAGAPGESKDKPRKSKKVKVIVLVTVLLLVGALAKFTVLAPSSSAEAAKPVKGPVVAMTDMTLNLADSHYLRLTLALQTIKGTNEELDTSEAAQLVISEYSNRTVASLTGEAARMKVQADLLAKLQKAYPKEIMSVYYTEFVMQ